MNHVDREGCSLLQMSAFPGKTSLAWLRVANLCLAFLTKRWSFGRFGFFLLFRRTCASPSHRTSGRVSDIFNLSTQNSSFLQLSSSPSLLLVLPSNSVLRAPPITVDAARRVSVGECMWRHADETGPGSVRSGHTVAPGRSAHGNSSTAEE